MEKEKDKKLHHANVIIGDNCRGFVFEILTDKLNFNVNANPDFSLVESQTFGIDEARDLERWAIGKPFLSDVKVSLLIINSITFEAQNALLKVLEEPPLGTYIFINLQSLGGLLPTFLSRVRILNSEKLSKGVFDSNTQKFLSGKIKEKFAMVRSLSKKENPTSLTPSHKATEVQRKLRGASKNEMRDLIKNLEAAKLA